MSGDESGYLSDAAIAGMSGDPALENLRAQPIALILPVRQTVPFIFASPHSGRLYPSSFARQSRLDPVTLRKSEDAFVDELFAAVPELGAPLIAARVPRAFVDVTRASGEIDPHMFDAPLASSIGPRLGCVHCLDRRMARDQFREKSNDRRRNPERRSDHAGCGRVRANVHSTSTVYP